MPHPANINPNSDRDFVNGYSSIPSAVDKVTRYGKFFDSIKIETFRHIKDVEIQFKNPITVIAGSNRSGKTSILLAIACSHYHFMRRSMGDGSFKRNSWKDMIRFSNLDEQPEDWKYYISFRNGTDIKINRVGYRKHDTNKWGGAAKKSGQIGTPNNPGDTSGRHAYFIDLDRVLPARNFSGATYKKITDTAISTEAEIKRLLSYVFERSIEVGNLSNARGNEMFGYQESTKYTSFNSASGEDVVSRILKDILEAPPHSLILIDEVEEGLHPKIQRRLMDVIYYVSRYHNKQFIITSHSPTILQSVSPESRVFIENKDGIFKVFHPVSIYAALSKMDSEAYPLVNIYVEDDVSKYIVDQAINELTSETDGILKLVRVIVVGSAERTYNYFKTRLDIFDDEKINSGSACILDGDMRSKYPTENLLFFHYSNEAPEKMLVQNYLVEHPNGTIQYHVENSNVHCLFQKMKEEALFISKQDALQHCVNVFRASAEGSTYFDELKVFLKQTYEHYNAIL